MRMTRRVHRSFVQYDGEFDQKIGELPGQSRNSARPTRRCRRAGVDRRCLTGPARRAGFSAHSVPREGNREPWEQGGGGKFRADPGPPSKSSYVEEIAPMSKPAPTG